MLGDRVPGGSLGSLHKAGPADRQREGGRQGWGEGFAPSLEL